MGIEGLSAEPKVASQLKLGGLRAAHDRFPTVEWPEHSTLVAPALTSYDGSAGLVFQSENLCGLPGLRFFTVVNESGHPAQELLEALREARARRRKR